MIRYIYISIHIHLHLHILLLEYVIHLYFLASMIILVIRCEVEKPLDTPLEDFVKFTEEHRRERERRVDAGDETAKLKFTRWAPFCFRF